MSEQFVTLLKANTAWILAGYWTALVLTLIVNVGNRVDKKSTTLKRGDLILATIVMLLGNLGALLILGIGAIFVPFGVIALVLLLAMAILFGAVYLLFQAACLLGKLAPVLDKIETFMSQPLFKR